MINCNLFIIINIIIIIILTSTLFQNGGSYVLAVDGGRERILSVWQWQWGHLLGKVAVSFLFLYSQLIFIKVFFLITLFSQNSFPTKLK